VTVNKFDAGKVVCMEERFRIDPPPLKIKEDPMCPLCGEEYDSRLHLLGRCNALFGK